MNITVRLTTKDEINVLYQIQKAAFFPLYKRYQDEKNPYLRSIDEFERRLNSPNYLYFTILNEEKIVGGILFQVKGTGVFFEELKQGEYYISRVYIDPLFQGQKIAQKAIRLCEKYFTDAKYFAIDFPLDLFKNKMCYSACGYKDTGKRFDVQPGLVLACYEKHV